MSCLKCDVALAVAQGLENLRELPAGVLLGVVQVAGTEAALPHALLGRAVEAFEGVGRASALFVEGACASLVDEVLVEQTHGRQREVGYAVAFGTEPVGAQLAGVEAQPQPALVDAHHVVVAEGAAAVPLHHFLRAHGEKFPLPYFAQTGYFLSRYVDVGGALHADGYGRRGAHFAQQPGRAQQGDEGGPHPPVAHKVFEE